MQFINQNTGWAVVKQGSYIYTLIKTTNQGTNWDVIYSDSEKVMNIQFFNDTLGYAIGFQYVTSLILRTTNGGYNWATVQSSGSYVYGNMNFINKDTGWVSAFLDGFPTQYVCVFQTVNGLQNINLLYSNQGSLSGTKLKFFNNSIDGQYFGYHLNQGGLWKTTNSGNNWSQINFIEAGTVISFSFINKDTGWVSFTPNVGANSKILFTSNNGQSWIQQFVSSFYNDCGFIQAVNKNKIWCGKMFESKILISTNGGNNWGNQASQIYVNGGLYMFDTILGFSWSSNQITRTFNGGGPIMSIRKISETTPSKIELKQNYPNPFNSETNIEFSIPKTSIVNLSLYDILGRKITDLISNKEYSSGGYRYTLNLIDYNLSSGVYIYKINSIEKESNIVFSSAKKLIYNK